MKMFKRLFKIVLLVGATALFSIAGSTVINQIPITMNVSAASIQDQEAVKRIMPNEKLRQLVLVNMKSEGIIKDSDFKVSDFTEQALLMIYSSLKP